MDSAFSLAYATWQYASAVVIHPDGRTEKVGLSIGGNVRRWFAGNVRVSSVR